MLGTDLSSLCLCEEPPLWGVVRRKPSVPPFCMFHCLDPEQTGITPGCHPETGYSEDLAQDRKRVLTLGGCGLGTGPLGMAMAT